MFYHQPMEWSAAGCSEDDGRSGKGSVINQVEEMLQCARIGSAVDRRSYDKKVRSFDCIDDVSSLIVELVGSQGAKENGRYMCELNHTLCAPQLSLGTMVSFELRSS
jgi:hypothetical protein